MIRYVIQSLYILGFWAVGTGVSFLLGGLIPGSVLGMVFLFAALAFGLIGESKVDGVSKLLIKYMVLFFLPASVGVMVAWELIAANFWAIIIAAIVSTVLIIGIVGMVQQKLGRRW